MTESEFEDRGLSRAELLRRGALGAAGAAALAGAGSAAAAPRRANALSAGDLATIKKYMGPVNPKFSGKGETWNVGAILPFTSAGSVYGIVQGNGVKLAVKHIEQLGGPRIKVDFRDHAGGDAVKGKNAVIAFEGKKIGAIISSYGGVIGAIIPEVGRKHILTLDPGGGNGPPFDRKPYFWGFRALPELDGLALAGLYLKQKLKGSRFLLATYDFGAVTQTGIDNVKKRLAPVGVSISDVVKPPYLATDYANALTAIRAAAPNCDAIYLGMFGFDLAYFLKQYKTSGINKPIFSFEGMLYPTQKIGGSGFDDVYMGGVDDFTTTTKNPWAQVFIKDYRATYGTQGLPQAVPDYYGAGYYDVTFAFWRLYRDVKAKGGNVNSGKDLQDALMANPRFPGVFGGGPGKVGITEMDLASHGLKHQPMALYQVRNGRPVKVAVSDIGGRNPKLL